MASIDPFTGEETYSPSTMGSGIAMNAMQGAGMDVPLAFRMMENMPGIATSIGFSTARGTNTIMRGGFLDNSGILAKRRMGKFQIMHGGSVSSVQPGHFVGSKGKLFGKRATRLTESGKAGWFKSARVNNITARPRALGRFHSLSVFGGGGYTPFGASRMLGGNKRVQSAFGSKGIKATADEGLLGPGLFSSIGAGRKADVLERKALKGSTRAMKKLQTLDSSIMQLGGMNNKAALFNPGKTPIISKKVALSTVADEFGLINTGVQYRAPANMTIGGKAYKKGQIVGGHAKEITRFEAGVAKPSVYEGARTAMVGPMGGEVGVRGNLLASSMYGSGTRYMAGYFRGAQGFGRQAGLVDDALRGAKAARYNMYEAIKATGLSGAEGKGATKAMLGMADEALEKGVFKTLGREGVVKALGTKAGAKVLGARALAMAIPGVNVVATAMMVYDLGKMAGEVVKSTINLAKDSVKSMKGTINKPMFGMGYQDTEAAATSRSRGVMAIQNSQLNARSALGHEGAMMAAHFG